MKRGFLITCSLVYCLVAVAQSLSLSECYSLAREHYPLIKQRELIEKSLQFSLENISKGYLPQFSFAGQAIYQSDVTKIPIKLPNIQIEDPSRNQFRVYGEVNQVVYDAGLIKEQKRMQEVQAEIEQQSLEVQLYAVKERINQLFFGILLIDEQLKQAAILRSDIQAGISKITGAFNNGAALKSSVDVLKAGLLSSLQHETELKAGKKAYLAMLSLFINKPVSENTIFEQPQELPVSPKISRPEITLFDYRKKNFDLQENFIKIKNAPRIGLFVQGGYGRPALNMLNNKFEFYYIGGVRFNWSLSGFYTAPKEKEILRINRNMMDVEKETFLFNVSMALSQQEADINKLKELISADQEIISLRASVKNTAGVQLQNGAITANDYMQEVDAEDRARQNLLQHRVQLLMTEYSYQATSGS